MKFEAQLINAQCLLYLLKSNHIEEIELVLGAYHDKHLKVTRRVDFT